MVKLRKCELDLVRFEIGVPSRQVTLGHFGFVHGMGSGGGARRNGGEKNHSQEHIPHNTQAPFKTMPAAAPALRIPCSLCRSATEAFSWPAVWPAPLLPPVERPLPLPAVRAGRPAVSRGRLFSGPARATSPAARPARAPAEESWPLSAFPEQARPPSAQPTPAAPRVFPQSSQRAFLPSLSYTRRSPGLRSIGSAHQRTRRPA